MRPLRSGRGITAGCFRPQVGQLLHAGVGLQNQTDDPQIKRGIAGQIPDARQSAEESGKRCDLDGDRTVEQHPRQAIRVELKRSGADIRLPGRQQARVTRVAQHDSLHGDYSITERAGDATRKPTTPGRGASVPVTKTELDCGLGLPDELELFAQPLSKATSASAEKPLNHSSGA